MSLALGGSTGPGEKLGVLKQRWVSDQMVILGNEVADIAAASRWVETGRHPMHKDWACLAGDRELVG